MLKRNIFSDFVKLIKYFASAAIEVSSFPCAWPSPKIKIFFLLSAWFDELLSAPKITTFLLQEFKIGKTQWESNLIPYMEQEYLPRSAFMVNLTGSNKQFFGVKAVF